jgi:hypothetical protein
VEKLTHKLTNMRNAQGGGRSAVNCTSTQRNTTFCAEKCNDKPDAGTASEPASVYAISALAQRSGSGGKLVKNSAHNAELSRSAGNNLAAGTGAAVDVGVFAGTGVTVALVLGAGGADLNKAEESAEIAGNGTSAIIMGGGGSGSELTELGVRLLELLKRGSAGRLAVITGASNIGAGTGGNSAKRGGGGGNEGREGGAIELLYDCIGAESNG